MNSTHLHCGRMLTLLFAICLAPGCGGSDNGGGSVEPVTITASSPNVVSYWNEVAANTINVPAASTGTSEERLPLYAQDLATVHVAIYDAVIAIAGTHRPYAVTPTANASGASAEAAASAAAYGVLKGLFPNRTAQYQAAYDSYVAAIANGEAKTKGLALGAEVAQGIVAARANDGRSVVLAPYVPGTAPGQFRGTNPVGRFQPHMKPFALTSTSQFRAPGPPALDSATYARDFDETKSLGVTNSATRTAEQTETARFATEPPPLHGPRNVRQFAMSGLSVADSARLMALLWVSQADAFLACFESKYHYNFWRPTSAITLADTDGNAATTPDAAWTPVVATPNHPEYPAAHACFAGSVAQVLSDFYGTRQVSFSFSSTVTGTTHHFASTDALIEELRMARIYGGMHFRTSTDHGATLGAQVARWVWQRHFTPRN